MGPLFSCVQDNKYSKSFLCLLDKIILKRKILVNMKTNCCNNFYFAFSYRYGFGFSGR